MFTRVLCELTYEKLCKKTPSDSIHFAKEQKRKDRRNLLSEV